MGQWVEELGADLVSTEVYNGLSRLHTLNIRVTPELKKNIEYD